MYALEAAIFIAGAAVQWLRDGLGIIENAPRDGSAGAIDRQSTGGVYFVPALTGLGAPHWEADARGTIVGLTRGTGARTSCAPRSRRWRTAPRRCLESMREASGATFDRLRVDGGATMNDWLMQFQADILGVPVERPDMVETTALGAAGLAGLAAGVWSIGRRVSGDDDKFTSFTPQMSRDERDSRWAAGIAPCAPRSPGRATDRKRSR